MHDFNSASRNTQLGWYEFSVLAVAVASGLVFGLAEAHVTGSGVGGASGLIFGFMTLLCAYPAAKEVIREHGGDRGEEPSEPHLKQFRSLMIRHSVASWTYAFAAVAVSVSLAVDRLTLAQAFLLLGALAFLLLVVSVIVGRRLRTVWSEGGPPSARPG